MKLATELFKLTVFLTNCLVFLANNIENCVENDEEYSVSDWSISGKSSYTGGNVINVSLRPKK